MKKIILKTSFFIIPFLGLYLFTKIFYEKDKGDLFRLGYIIDFENYNRSDIFKEDYKTKKIFNNVSEINLNDSINYDVLTIGDSFSEQENLGYQNALAKLNNTKILHLDNYLNNNPIETLNSFLNGNVLDKIKVKYIILESVERLFVQRREFDTKKIIDIDSLSNNIKKNKDKIKNEISKKESKEDFFSRETLKFSLTNIYYLFDDNAFKSQTYRVKTNHKLFSVNDNRLLFFEEDIKNISINNDNKNIIKLNNILNNLSERLSKKGMKLIVIPCPDKLDFYYEFISEKSKYTKPIFFDTYQNLPKKYFFINSKKILLEKGKNMKDLYFFDDTHWSPKASNIIAKELIISKPYIRSL